MAAESCRDFHCTDAPVFPGAVTSCARFNLPPTFAPPCSPFCPFSPFSLSLTLCSCRRQPPATPRVSRSNARLFRRSFRVLSPFNNPGIRCRKSARWYKRSDERISAGLAWRGFKISMGKSKIHRCSPTSPVASRRDCRRAGSSLLRILSFTWSGPLPFRSREISSFGENEFTCRDNVQRVENRDLKRETEEKRGVYLKLIKEFSRHLKYICEEYRTILYVRVSIYRTVNILIVFL